MIVGHLAFVDRLNVMRCYTSQCLRVKKIVQKVIKYMRHTSLVVTENKKAGLSQGNRAMPQLFFSV